MGARNDFSKFLENREKWVHSGNAAAQMANQTYSVCSRHSFHATDIWPIQQAHYSTEYEWQLPHHFITKRPTKSHTVGLHLNSHDKMILKFRTCQILRLVNGCLGRVKTYK